MPSKSGSARSALRRNRRSRSFAEAAARSPRSSAGSLPTRSSAACWREAIRQLAASGLIESRAHRGSVVAQPDHEHLIGMFEAMAELEALCAGLAAARITPAERHALAA